MELLKLSLVSSCNLNYTDKLGSYYIIIFDVNYIFYILEQCDLVDLQILYFFLFAQAFIPLASTSLLLPLFRHLTFDLGGLFMFDDVVA